ncbi:MAG: FAD-dependent oxidoreductase, partial [Deltaproteobacteria bacterium]|nr:FAD-dependent oxidoreductase [Kofleriaceae bacterium]
MLSPHGCWCRSVAVEAVVDSLPARAQVAIVGGGVAGLATAWALAEGGAADVVVLEREAALASHASGRNA